MRDTPARSFWSDILEDFLRSLPEKQKAVLVTGAAGCLGSNLCKWLVENQPEFTIIALDNLSGGYLDWIPTQCKIYIRDCGSNLDDIFETYNVQYVFHASAIASESIANFNRKFYYANNVVDSANIINYSIKYDVARLVYFSSMAVYGNNPTPFVETQPNSPIDCYGIGKAAVELDLKCAKEQHGLRYSIVRPHSVFGTNQNIWDTTRNVLGIWLRKILNGEPVTIYGDGLQQRAFTDVSDILLPLWKCATEESTLWEIFNIGNDQEMTLLEALEILEEVVGFKPERKYYPAIHEAKNAFSDHTKAKTILGLECKTPLREGLEKMWNWAKEQPKRPLQTFDKFELEVGLYEQFR